jgi:hypothetical protein
MVAMIVFIVYSGLRVSRITRFAGLMAASSTQWPGNRIVSKSEALLIPLTECGSPVGR